MKLLTFGMLALMGILSACAPKVNTQVGKTYSPLGEDEEIIVFGLTESFPEEAEELGTVRISDTGFTLACTYEIVIEKAKTQARKAGGNALVITEHKTPNALGSSCHRIQAKIIRIPNPQDFVQEEDNTIEDKNIALLHIYRFGGMGSLVGYNLYLGDSLICRVKNNWKETLVIKKSGRNILWAKTEAKSEVPIVIDLGREYYIRCGIAMGAMVGRPTIALVGSKTGQVEFISVKDK